MEASEMKISLPDILIKIDKDKVSRNNSKPPNTKKYLEFVSNYPLR